MTSLETTVINWPGSDSTEVIRWDKDYVVHPPSLCTRNQRPGWWDNWSTVRSTCDYKSATLMVGKHISPHFATSLSGGAGWVGIYYICSVPYVSHRAWHEVLFLSSSLKWCIFFSVLPEKLNRDNLRSLRVINHLSFCGKDMLPFRMETSTCWLWWVLLWAGRTPSSY